MDLSQLHFSQPLWFWSLLVLPLVWGLFFLYYQGQLPLHQLEKFIDKHLLPYLLIEGEYKKKRGWPSLIFWSLVWTCLVLALAGPRWDFREIATFTRDQNLAILLDLSESMNAKDLSPSRLGRAKQKIEDLLNISTGVKMGLVAFAADAHMIVPMTEDKETIRHLLPSLETDLVHVQGSKLAPALEMAATMLKNEPGTNKAIVAISDGGFEDASAIHTAKKLAGNGIILYAVGVGTLEGAPLKDRLGNVVKKNGSPLISKLEKEKFREISKIGNGRFFGADHSESMALIFEDLEKRSNLQQEAHKKQRLWEEHFYIFLLPVLPFFLWWYRRGCIFATLFFSLIPTHAQASLSTYFYNSEQQADLAYENGDYPAAVNTFQDPYRKGVAYYRMGNYTAAEEMFRLSTRPEVASSAAYNLGNTLAHQNKLQEAVAAYEGVLQKWPDHKQARDNLELIKKMLEQQEKQQQDSQNSPSDSEQQKNDQNQQSKKDNKSFQEDSEKPSKDQPQKDSSSEEKEAENAQKQENTEEESSQTPAQEKELSQNDLEAQEPKDQKSPPQPGDKKAIPRSQSDLDADLWLNQIKNDPKSFLKNKFYLESRKNGTKEEIDPW